MVFLVIEIQSDGETAATLVNSYTDKNLAESKYHQILAAAAVSTVKIHSAVLMTERGGTIKSETYSHDDETEI